MLAREKAAASYAAKADAVRRRKALVQLMHRKQVKELSHARVHRQNAAELQNEVEELQGILRQLDNEEAREATVGGGSAQRKTPVDRVVDQRFESVMTEGPPQVSSAAGNQRDWGQLATSWLGQFGDRLQHAAQSAGLARGLTHGTARQVRLQYIP